MNKVDMIETFKCDPNLTPVLVRALQTVGVQVMQGNFDTNKDTLYFTQPLSAEAITAFQGKVASLWEVAIAKPIEYHRGSYEKYGIPFEAERPEIALKTFELEPEGLPEELTLVAEAYKNILRDGWAVATGQKRPRTVDDMVEDLYRQYPQMHRQGAR